MLTGWKRDAEAEWLAEPSKGPLQESLRQLQGAFERFWRKQTGYRSVCGEVASAMPLNVREWTCRCGVVHDRDVNAARNILAVGLTVAACGDGVRPPRT
jgi:hypothetical protein